MCLIPGAWFLFLKQRGILQSWPSARVWRDLPRPPPPPASRPAFLLQVPSGKAPTVLLIKPEDSACWVPGLDAEVPLPLGLGCGWDRGVSPLLPAPWPEAPAAEG